MKFTYILNSKFINKHGLPKYCYCLKTVVKLYCNQLNFIDNLNFPSNLLMRIIFNFK